MPPHPPPPRSTDEVPYITSPDHVTLEMLRICGVGPSDHVIAQRHQMFVANLTPG